LKQLDIESPELTGGHNLDPKYVPEHLMASVKDCFGAR